MKHKEGPHISVEISRCDSNHSVITRTINEWPSKTDQLCLATIILRAAKRLACDFCPARRRLPDLSVDTKRSPELIDIGVAKLFFVAEFVGIDRLSSRGSNED